jgi:hypothetical protein
VALAYISGIDDPKRFTHARDVGAYLGLTPKRYQSGEVDLAGRISKCGDGFARTCLYEAAGVLMTRVERWSPLKAWGVRLMKRIGATKAPRWRSLASWPSSCIASGRMGPNSGGRRRLQRPDRSSTPEFRASGNAVLAGTAGRDDRASCVVRRYDHYRAVRIFTLRHHYPSNP